MRLYHLVAITLFHALVILFGMIILLTGKFPSVRSWSLKPVKYASGLGLGDIPLRIAGAVVVTGNGIDIVARHTWLGVIALGIATFVLLSIAIAVIQSRRAQSNS